METGYRPGEATGESEGQHGFSLIELLVVVIVIGVLAGVAIPVYLGIRDRAADAAVQTDLRSDRAALVGYQADHAGALPPSSTVDPVGLATYGFVQGPQTAALDYSVQGPASARVWCLLARSSSGRRFTVSTNTPVSDGSTSACPVDF